MDIFVDKLKLLWSKTNRWHRVIFIFLLIELNVIPGHKMGFRCNDPALSYPFTGDTISWKWLISVCALIPLPIMLIVERTFSTDKHMTKRRVLRWYKEYIYGFMINLTLVQIVKTIVGSPRPHFFDTCKPKEALTCIESEFVSTYSCTKATWLQQSDRSFPSGHASLSLHAAVFIIYYLHQRTANYRPLRLFPHHVVRTVQTISITTAILCAGTRLSDHRHHWWDVFAGLFIGVVVLIYTVLHLCGNFERTSDFAVVTERTADRQVRRDTNSSVGSPLIEHTG